MPRRKVPKPLPPPPVVIDAVGDVLNRFMDLDLPEAELFLRFATIVIARNREDSARSAAYHPTAAPPVYTPEVVERPTPPNGRRRRRRALGAGIPAAPVTNAAPPEAVDPSTLPVPEVVGTPE